MTSEQALARLAEIVLQRSVERGTFALSNGGTTDLYLDVRQTTLNGEGAALVGRLVLERIGAEVVGIGGPTLGADPVACSAVAMSQAVLGRPIHGFLIRKEAKGHGTGRYVEGMASLYAGAKVCLVEDTTTTGGSLLRAAQRAKEAGLDVVQCIIVVDRQEGARARFEEAELPFEALLTRADLGL